jgi:serine/threonine protein phosphatase PrpC
MLRAVTATDVGRVRSVNQDLALVLSDLVAVADGMGGHLGGEVAARTAVDTLARCFTEDRSAAGLLDAVRQANRAVYDQGQTDANLRGMGTTLTAVALVQLGPANPSEPAGRDHSSSAASSDLDSDGAAATEGEGAPTALGERLAIVNVGDSRAYLFLEDRLVQLTEDHSLVEEMVRQGELTAEEALVHPHRHILTRALGIELGVEIDAFLLHPPIGARLLLCSDGLTNELSDAEIANILNGAPDPRIAADRLVAAALEHGGSDNVTVVVAELSSSGSEHARETAAGITGDDGASDRGSTVDGGGGTEPARTASTLLAPTALATTPIGTPGADLGGATAGASGRTAERVAGGDELGLLTDLPVLSDQALLEALGLTRFGPEAPPRGPARLSRGIDTSRTGAIGSSLATSTLATSPLVAPPPARPPVLVPADPASPIVLLPAELASSRLHRMAGSEHIVTGRVLLFIACLVIIVGGAVGAVLWFAESSYFVGLDGSHVAIFEGRPGGLLWFHPKVVDRTPVTTAQILGASIPELETGALEPSFAAARRLVNDLVTEQRRSRTTTTIFASGTPRAPRALGVARSAQTEWSTPANTGPIQLAMGV